MSEEKKEIVNNNEEIVEVNSKQSFFSRLNNKRKIKKEKKLQQLENETLSDEESKKVEEKLEEFSKEVQKSGSKKKKILNIVFFVFNILLVVGILMWNAFSSEGFSPLVLSDLNFSFITIVLLFLFLIVAFDVFSVHRMIYMKTLRSRWFLAYKSFGVLRYYDSITPLSSGGQPFMVNYLTGRDVNSSTALSIPMSKLIFQKATWLIITFVCLIISFREGISQSLVSAASIIGFVLSFLLVAIVLLISFSRKLGEKLVSGTLKLLVKMHLLKNFEKSYNKVMNFVDDYQKIMKEYSKSKWDIFLQLFLHTVKYVLLFSIPYFIYLAFPYQGGKIGSYGEFFVFTALIDLASSFIPIPGGTGMNEITFAALFSGYLGSYTFWALLFWRFCSYYFYLLQGLSIISYDTLYGNRKYRWVKKKLALQDESKDFKKMQIENFRQERSKRRKSQKRV